MTLTKNIFYIITSWINDLLEFGYSSDLRMIFVLLIAATIVIGSLAVITSLLFSIAFIPAFLIIGFLPLGMICCLGLLLILDF